MKKKLINFIILWVIYVICLLFSYRLWYGLWYGLNVILGMLLLRQFIEIVIEEVRNNRYLIIVALTLLLVLTGMIVYYIFPLYLGRPDIYNHCEYIKYIK